MNKFWQITNKISDSKDKKDEDVLDIVMYGYVLDEESFWDDGGIIADQFAKDLADYPNAKNINISINSYGGSATAGIAIYNQLKQHPAYVTITVDGIAASAASVIAMAADELIMAIGSQLMTHQAGGGARGYAKDLRQYADTLDNFTNSILDIYQTKCTKKTRAEIQELVDAETWMSAQQAVDYGFADRTSENKISASLKGKTLVLNGIGFEISKLGKNIPEDFKNIKEIENNNSKMTIESNGKITLENNNPPIKNSDKKEKEIKMSEENKMSLVEQIRNLFKTSKEVENVFKEELLNTDNTEKPVPAIAENTVVKPVEDSNNQDVIDAKVKEIEDKKNAEIEAITSEKKALEAKFEEIENAKKELQVQNEIAKFVDSAKTEYSCLVGTPEEIGNKLYAISNSNLEDDLKEFVMNSLKNTSNSNENLLNETGSNGSDINAEEKDQAYYVAEAKRISKETGEKYTAVLKRITNGITFPKVKA